jgi:chromosome partition protein MukF
VSTPALPAPPELHRVLGGLAERKLGLELGTLELCFVVLLHVRGQQLGLAAFTEEQLVDAFEQACNAVEPGTEQVRARGNHAIRRLREQRLLTRVDGAGVVRAGEFTLSRLGAGIAEFFLEEQVLDKESLVLFTRTLAASLAQLIADGRLAASPSEFQERVGAPLRLTIPELLGGIERRQRGLDVQQEDFQAQISNLLSADWFGAIEQCQSLLDTTAATLRELNEVLLHDSHHLSLLLTELAELSEQAGAAAAEQSAQRLLADVERITAWGAARQKAWSEYYEYVHRYLRDVVRLDPTRALTQRLREQLADHAKRPFALVVANAAPLRVLREVRAVVEPPPVRRPKKAREVPPETKEPAPDPMLQLETNVRSELARGVTSLSELTMKLTDGLSPTDRFLTAGRIADIVARLTRPLAVRERPWVHLTDDLAIEQRTVREHG